MNGCAPLRMPVIVRNAPIEMYKYAYISPTKALSTNAKIVILDEPTASLTKRESEELYRIVDQLKEKGVSIT